MIVLTRHVPRVSARVCDVVSAKSSEHLHNYSAPRLKLGAHFFLRCGGQRVACRVAWFVVRFTRVKSAVVIRHIFISPGHNFFGRYGRPPGTHAATDVLSVRCRAGLGLEGDRFFGYRPDYSGQVTFFGWEVYEAIKLALALPRLAPSAFRRNILIEGAHLNSLVGSRFSLGGVDFEGMCESKPCDWMNTAVAPGAEKWLRGQGGLRAKILTDGTLTRGPAELCAHDLLALG